VLADTSRVADVERTVASPTGSKVAAKDVKAADKTVVPTDRR
jgi:hypothetical protein